MLSTLRLNHACGFNVMDKLMSFNWQEFKIIVVYMIYFELITIHALLLIFNNSPMNNY